MKRTIFQILFHRTSFFIFIVSFSFSCVPSQQRKQLEQNHLQSTRNAGSKPMENSQLNKTTSSISQPHHSSVFLEKPVSKVLLVQGIESLPEGQYILVVNQDGKAEFSYTALMQNAVQNKTLIPKSRNLRLFLEQPMRDKLFSCLETYAFFDQAISSLALKKQYQEQWQQGNILGLFVAAGKGMDARRTLLFKIHPQAQQVYHCFQETWIWMKKQFELM